MLDVLVTKRQNQHYLAPNLKQLVGISKTKEEINSEKLLSMWKIISFAWFNNRLSRYLKHTCRRNARWGFKHLAWVSNPAFTPFLFHPRAKTSCEAPAIFYSLLLSSWHPLSRSIFFPFTLIPTTILRDAIVYTDENPTALPPDFSFSWPSPGRHLDL